MKNTNEKDLKFYKRLKIFKESHPHIEVKLPRNMKIKNPPPYMQKKYWKSKTMQNTFQMDLQFLQHVEESQYTDWKQFRQHLRKVFRNPNMKINVMIISEQDII